MAGAGGRGPHDHHGAVFRFPDVLPDSPQPWSFTHFLSRFCAKLGPSPSNSPQASCVSGVGLLLSGPSFPLCPLVWGAGEGAEVVWALRPWHCICGPGYTDGARQKCDPPEAAEVGIRPTPKARRRGQSMGQPSDTGGLQRQRAGCFWA